MGKVKVSTFAREMGMSNDKLLEQLEAAGVNKHSPEQFVNDEDKRQLLAYLRKTHGGEEEEAADSPSKITLKKRSTRQVKQSFSHGRQKTVNVEVRKRRTFVKRRKDEEEPEEAEEAGVEATEAGEALQEADTGAAEPQAAQPETAQGSEEGEAAQAAGTEAESAAAPTEGAEAVEAGAEVTPAEEAEETAEATEEVIEGAAEEAVEAAPAPEPAQAPQEAPAQPEQPQPATEEGGKKGKGKKGKKEEESREDRQEAQEAGITSRKQRKKQEKQSRRTRRRREPEHQFEKPQKPVVREVEIPETITVEELSNRMAMKAGEVIKQLMNLGMMMTKNDTLDADTATLVVEELGHKPKMVSEEVVEEEVLADETIEGEAGPRPPVVTVMGHVDHGKTSLLDRIREADVTTHEAGGITQHIGAYHVDTPQGTLVFLDTPGHEAFTAMRARGADVTDLVILVVAADDGVKPQTLEAIDHAKAAGVPMVVAVNKTDVVDADPDKVKQELAQRDLIPEDWGGETMFVNVSAKNGDNVEQLLEYVLLQAEMLELSAIADGRAKGVIVESELDRGRGPVATVLVQEGTLRKGDMLLAGPEYGRVRALVNEHGEQVDHAGPSMPVEVLGLSGVPQAGDDALVVSDERKAREVSEMRHQRMKDQELAQSQRAKLEGMFEQMQQGEVSELPLVIKADVQGSSEALRESLEKLSNDEVRVKVIHNQVGGINESDVNLALASDAIIIGFNVRAEASARRLIEQQGVDVRYFSVIYEAADAVKAALEGLLAPEVTEEIIGRAEVRDIFRVPKMGSIAGCQVVEGRIERNANVRVLRDNVVIYSGTLESLKRFKEDAKEVREGYECGIGIRDYNDVKLGDILECYVSKEVTRTLD